MTTRHDNAAPEAWLAGRPGPTALRAWTTDDGALTKQARRTCPVEMTA